MMVPQVRLSLFGQLGFVGICFDTQILGCVCIQGCSFPVPQLSVVTLSRLVALIMPTMLVSICALGVSKTTFDADNVDAS